MRESIIPILGLLLLYILLTGIVVSVYFQVAEIALEAWITFISYLLIIFLMTPLLIPMLDLSDRYFETIFYTSLITFLLTSFIMVAMYLFPTTEKSQCKTNKTLSFYVLIATNDFINNIKYLGANDRHSRYSPEYSNRICEVFYKTKKHVESIATIDYRNDLVNDLIFDYSYNKTYYEYVDYGEKNYNILQTNLQNEIFEKIH